MNGKLDLPGAESVSFNVFDLQGRMVMTQAPRAFGAGRSLLSWNGRLSAGGPAPPGLYLASVRVGEKLFFRRIALIH